MDKLKITAIVKSKGNWGESIYYVMNRPIKMVYTKIDSKTIIGRDEGVLEFYHKEGCSKNYKAFAGREFDLPLTDGTVEHCYGQWWDAMSDTARELYSQNEIAHFASSTIEELKKCYVFCGGRCEKSWLEKLVSEYKGEIYDYWEYEKTVKKEE